MKDALKIPLIGLVLLAGLVIIYLLTTAYQGIYGINTSLRFIIIFLVCLFYMIIFYLYFEVDISKYVTYLGLVALSVNGAISLYNEDFFRQLALDPKISISLKRYDADLEKNAIKEKKNYQLLIEAENKNAQFLLETVWVNPTVRYYDSSRRSLINEKILKDPRLFSFKDFTQSKRNIYTINKLKFVLCSDPSIEKYCKNSSMEIVDLWVKLEYRVDSAHRKPQKIGKNRFVISGHKIFVD